MDVSDHYPIEMEIRGKCEYLFDRMTHFSRLYEVNSTFNSYIGYTYESKTEYFIKARFVTFLSV